MGRRTPLYNLHLELGARLVDFGGWDMPVQYSSQLEEHRAVRSSAGLFDVSHMCVIDVRGSGARAYLKWLLANDVDKLRMPGKALYSCMLNERGGIIDDLIVTFVHETWFRIVVNAGTRDGDLAWMREQAHGREVEIVERADLAMIAAQGPRARALVADLLPERERDATLALEPFYGRAVGDWFVSRTGYTGEDGFEIMLPADAAEDAWRKLNTAGAMSCGLGARDTLRLEAGMNLYGNDMDENLTPLESGLAWTVAMEPATRDFVGREALQALKTAGVPRKFVGLLLEARGVLRAHQRLVIAEVGEGEVTSGTFSPTLERSIGFARVPRATAGQVQVDIRGKLLDARVVKLPFVRNGRILIQL